MSDREKEGIVPAWLGWLAIAVMVMLALVVLYFELAA
jgi:hypothetical protein